MSEVVAFNRAALRRNSRKAQRLALLAQIIEAFEKPGGNAHYDLVIDQICADRRLIDAQARLILRRQVLEVFAAHCEAENRAEDCAMFRRVYGADSRRWGFSKGFRERMQRGVVDLDQHLG